ncbi:hypothetical protein [Hyphococcus luteus]|uniref:Uncharacterized protein n=1 Tax=Hyphococcus luteus TaxID=2058213 RepID=A0A2S7KAN2_9PROT|nr:hypothetical protein [Marinicaulis flavus]PQA89541.1 hypothetical protein CW354_01325 [Marinicaulis flavus]
MFGCLLGGFFQNKKILLLPDAGKEEITAGEQQEGRYGEFHRMRFKLRRCYYCRRRIMNGGTVILFRRFLH